MFENYTVHNWAGRKFVQAKVLPNVCRELYLNILENKNKFYEQINDSNTVELEDLDRIKSTYSDINAIRTLPKLDVILPYINFCVESIMQDSKSFYLKNWLNISPKNQRLPGHFHQGTYHGFWVINDTGTKTIYTLNDKEYAIDNSRGNFVFGPADVYHTLTPNNSDALRISLGFTVFTKSQVELQKKYPQKIFDKLGATVE